MTLSIPWGITHIPNAIIPIILTTTSLPLHSTVAPHPNMSRETPALIYSRVPVQHAFATFQIAIIFEQGFGSLWSILLAWNALSQTISMVSGVTWDREQPVCVVFK